MKLGNNNTGKRYARRHGEKFPSVPKVHRNLLNTISDKDDGMTTVGIASIMISDSISSRNNNNSRWMKLKCGSGGRCGRHHGLNRINAEIHGFRLTIENREIFD